MKLALLADIHANLPALQAVAAHLDAWRPDHVLVAGDVINRGPRPAECLAFIQERRQTDGWLVTRGNHEEYVMVHAKPDSPRSGPQFDIWSGSFWTYQRLHGDISSLETMPFQINLTAPDGGQVCATHASALGTREGIHRRTPDDELARKIGSPAPAALGVGHTHIPLVRRLDGTLVVNAGAVGLPFDGDARASYAQMTWRREGWQAEIVRLDYDRGQANRDFEETGFLDEAPAFALLVQSELRTARSAVFEWLRAYEARVLAGEMTMLDSVRRFLAE